ncbi:hypothetical protein [Sphingomonas kyeonggiensis]|uniref:Uncharacterized protein n=1 Tax=Sphingomonas kyeonggiensis TaxID=1268553 RepID=A0A7W6JQE6_9SPHN|nr:hypothetical protein [Sphingomonas kyeonggiensis]MBB4096560.1 hypothetical protein [Sphingomonas kyeonggiensis]
MKKTLLNAAAAALLLLPLGTATASDQKPGKVTSVQQTLNRFFFYTNGTRTARPSCDCCGRWEIDANTAAGQAQISIVLTAYATQRTLEVAGTGSCVGGANDTEGVNILIAT